MTELTFYGNHIDSGVKNEKKTRRGINKITLNINEVSEYKNDIPAKDIFYFDKLVTFYRESLNNYSECIEFYKDPQERTASRYREGFPQYIKGGFAYFGLFRRIQTKINKKKAFRLSIINNILLDKFDGFYHIQKYIISFLIDRKGIFVY